MSLGRAARLLHASTAWTRCIHHEAQAATGLAAAVAKERGSSSAMEVFDRQAPCTAATPPGCTGFTIMHPCRQQKQAHRDRAAALRMPRDPLLTTITDRLLDRLDDCVAKFPTAVILGGAGDFVARRLLASSRAGVQQIIHIDASQQMLDLSKAQREQHVQDSQKEHEQSADADSSSSSNGSGSDDSHSSNSEGWPPTTYIQAHEEQLPLEPGSVDLIISCLGLHWANDLPGAMAQCRLALKPDGLFLAAMFGGETLQELRIACAAAQLEREGGISPFISPLAQVRDAGNLLTRAGFALPTVDVDTFELQYTTPLELVEHLRAQGESNALLVKAGSLHRDQALAAAAAYQGMFGAAEEEGGGVPATYQVMFMTGWSPARNQPKAAARGSATISFAEFAKQIDADKEGGTPTSPS